METAGLVCPAGWAWLEVEGKELPAAVATYNTPSAQACRELCQASRGCSAFDFELAVRSCRLADSRLPPITDLPVVRGTRTTTTMGMRMTMSMQAGLEFILGKRWCPSERLIGVNCWATSVYPSPAPPPPLWPAPSPCSLAADHILMGYAARVADAASIEECADICRNTEIDGIWSPF